LNLKISERPGVRECVVIVTSTPQWIRQAAWEMNAFDAFWGEISQVNPGHLLAVSGSRARICLSLPAARLRTHIAAHNVWLMLGRPRTSGSPLGQGMGRRKTKTP
jgi:hypothetical protein